jgi:hypothetical protein
VHVSEPAAPEVPASDRLVFLGGVHRSGTTLLADLLGEHPNMSALSETGVWHDEGQFLQDVYPTALDCGGPGKFAFNARARLTEADATGIDGTGPDALAAQILGAWTPYWNLQRRYLVEKSPPNLLRFRYLQALFPDAHFIAIVRHPVAVAYATAGWAKTPVAELLEHWLVAHEAFERDRPAVHRLTFLRYEDLVRDVPGTLATVCASLGVEPFVPDTEVRPDTNERYLRRWRHSRVSPLHPRVLVHRARFERRLDALGYGYSLKDQP